VARFTEQAERKYDVEMASAKLNSLYSPVVQIIELLGVLTVLGSGAWLLAHNQLTVGALLAFVTFLGGLYGPLRRLGGIANSAYATSAGAERVLQVRDEAVGGQGRPRCRRRRHCGRPPAGPGADLPRSGQSSNRTGRGHV
jgi:ATP-binding cassette subfamily B protein